MKRSRDREVTRLGAAYAASGLLNGLKFVLLPLLLSAHELDVVAVGLLLAVTLSQVPGEALANHRAVTQHAGERPRRYLLLTALTLLGLAAIAPDAAATVLAGGFSLEGADGLAITCFAAAGAAWVLLWNQAGKQQAEGDLSGLRVVAVAPNVALLTGLILSGGNVATTAAGMAAVLILVALVAFSRTTRPRQTNSPSVAPAPPPYRGILAMVAAAFAVQANLLWIRVATGDFPAGSLGGLYIAIGIAVLPVMVTAGSAAAGWLPDWASDGRWTRAPDWKAVGRVAGLSFVLGMGVAAAALMLLRVPGVAGLIDHSVTATLESTLPWLALGVPIGAAAWVLRGWLLATGRGWAYVGTAIAGSCLVLLAGTIGQSVAAIAIGFSLSPLPTILLALVVAMKQPSRSPSMLADG